MFRKTFSLFNAAVVATGVAMAASAPSADAQQAKKPPKYFDLPGSKTALRIGGFAKLVSVYDLNAYRDDMRFFPQLIPRPGRPIAGATSGQGDKFFVDSRHSRVFVRTTTPTDFGSMRTHIEGDFYATSGTEAGSSGFRRRHAYATLGKWRIGWTWSNFMDLRAYPENANLFGPANIVFVRQSGISFTQPLGGKNSLMLAAEFSSHDIDGGSPLEQIPDLHARVNIIQPWGHITAAGVLRYFRIDSPTAILSSDEEIGFGLSLSGDIRTVGKDKITWLLAGGDGLGSYMASFAGTGSDAAVDPATGKIDALTLVGGYLGYTHWWSKKLRSGIMYGVASVDNKDYQAASVIKKVTGAEINLFWSPVPATNWGIAWAWAEREDKDGLDGEANRIYLTFQFIY